MTSESQECHSPPGAGYRGGRAFRVSTRRRWGCDATLRRAACVGARLFFRERQQRRRQRAPLEHVSREDKNLSCHASIKAQSGHVGEGDERKRSASARPKTTTESVPRSVEDLISRVIHVVKTSCTRLAVYLRGWDSLREYSAGFVEKPPACKPCLSTAAKHEDPKRILLHIVGCSLVYRCQRKAILSSIAMWTSSSRPRASSRLVEIRFLWRLSGGRQAKSMSP